MRRLEPVLAPSRLPEHSINITRPFPFPEWVTATRPSDGVRMTFKPVESMMGSRIGAVQRLGKYLDYLLGYRSLLESMVKKDFKGKFKYTALGYAWHVINPLFQILVYYVVFTVVFGRDVPNYWVYISTGMFLFSFASSCIRGCCDCVVKNANMVTKISFAKEVLVGANVLTHLTTLVITYAILALLMLVSGVGLTWYVLYVPVIVAILVVFLIGLGLLLSALTVYYRDVSNAIGVVMSCMLFALPIIYLTSQIESTAVDVIWHINPLFYFVESIHNAFYYGMAPDLTYMLICIASALVMLVVGLYVFKKLENGFAERL